jgi:hypothetical protein
MEFSVTTNLKSKNPRKKLHRIYEKTFVVIDDSLVRHFGIEDEDVWVEQKPVEGGIFMRICRQNIQRQN